MNYDDEAKKRRTCPVFSSTYSNKGWSDRDALPTGDPIGDVDKKMEDEWVEGYKQWKNDLKAYEEKMKSKTLNPKGKYTHDRKPLVTTEPKCDCGTEAVYGKVPVNAHRHYCKLRN